MITNLETHLDLEKTRDRLQHLSQLGGLLSYEKQRVSEILGLRSLLLMTDKDRLFLECLWRKHGYSAEVENLVVTVRTISAPLLHDRTTAAIICQRIQKAVSHLVDLRIHHGSVRHISQRLESRSLHWVEFDVGSAKNPHIFRGDFWLKQSLGMDAHTHYWVPSGVYSTKLFKDWIYERNR